MEAPVRDPQVPASEDVAELHLLISEMDDELTRYRWREAVWLSLVVHILVFLAIIFLPPLIPKGAVVLPVTPLDMNKNTTYLELPSDKQRVKAPNTDIISDKNRIAQSPTPLPSREMIRKLVDANRPGRPAPATPPPAPQQQAQQQTPAQGNNGQQQGAGSPAPPPQPAQMAQLEQPQHQPAPAKNPSPFKTAGPGIQQAIESMPASHGAKRISFTLGNHGYSPMRPNSTVYGDAEILSDTMGVDFSDYLQRVKYALQTNWDNLIPEGARYKHGKLAIRFSILKPGTASGIAIAASSGDVTLDRPAYGSITASSPFDPLPSEFRGTYIEILVRFYYNPDPNKDGMD